MIFTSLSYKILDLDFISGLAWLKWKPLYSACGHQLCSLNLLGDIYIYMIYVYINIHTYIYIYYWLLWRVSLAWRLIPYNITIIPVMSRSRVSGFQTFPDSDFGTSGRVAPPKITPPFWVQTATEPWSNCWQLLDSEFSFQPMIYIEWYGYLS